MFMQKITTLIVFVFVLLSLISVRAETTSSYVTFELEYNKDVFESVERYRAQFKDKNGNYVKEAGRFQYQVQDVWSFSAYVYNNYALDEDTFTEKLGIDIETGKANVGGVPFQFGKIKSAIDGQINESNVIASSNSGRVVIEVPDNYYSEIHTAMWAYTDRAKVSVIYEYADGTSSGETGITEIAGGKNVVPAIAGRENLKTMTNDNKASVLCCREYNPYYDNDEPGSGFKISVTDHILKPDENKILDKIEITFKNAYSTLFAMTGKVTDCTTLEEILKEKINKCDTTSLEELEEVVKVGEIIFGNFAESNYNFNAEFKQSFDTLKGEMINCIVDSFKSSVENILMPYTSEQKETVASAEKYYRKIIEWNISAELIGTDLFEKYEDVYEAYNDANALEKEIQKLSMGYDYTRYDEFLALMKKVESNGKNVLDTYHRELLDEFTYIVYETVFIDGEISKLPEVYDASMKEKVCELFERYCHCADTGIGNKWFFEYGEKLTDLYKQTGMCGKSAKWEVVEGCLYINGEGEMLDFISGDSVPWFEFTREITKLVVSNKIEKIGRVVIGSLYGLEEIKCYNASEKWNEINEEELSWGVKPEFIPNLELISKQVEEGIDIVVGFYNIKEKCEILAIDRNKIKVYDRETAENGFKVDGKVKVVAWESLTTLKPLCEPQSVK